MVKKILLNIFLNIAIITLVLSLFWLFNNGHYAVGAAAVACLGMFIYFKLLLIRSVKKTIRDRKNSAA
ncbi:MAG TPA: DUF6358 family protein [Sphingobacteriaceae bacterium]